MNWRSTLIGPEASILDAVNQLDAAGLQIVLVVNENGQLLGTVTDGDVRRAILSAVGLEGKVSCIMNRHPTYATPGATREQLLDLFAGTKLKQVPLINSDRQIIGLITIDGLLQTSPRRDNPVVLMAGGLGMRLRPLTENTPKPLLELGGKPLLETILEKLVAQNFYRFYISVNYRGDMIKDHFGDGSRWNVDIRYLDEDEPLGTAGALSLMPERPQQPFLVMNGDLLTELNFGNMLAFHQEKGAQATMAVREYDIEVPFGVVETNTEWISAIKEKPVHRFLVNAGIYVLDPDVFDRIPTAERLDMPHLFNELAQDGGRAAVFPVRESWIDIGRFEDLERARRQLGISV